MRPVVGWRSFSLALATLLCGATAGLVWLGYRATREWERSTVLLVERRADVMLALLATALSRDMRGAQVSALVPIEGEDLEPEPPDDLRDAFARAFARFPYPESFFMWKAGHGGEGTAYFFNRADRPPPWDPAGQRRPSYPVVIVRDPPGTRNLLAAARQQARTGKRFVVFEDQVGDVPYQVVVQLFHGAFAPDRLTGMTGFVVNLSWVRERYFGELARQIARIGGDQEPTALAILDDAGRTVAAIGALEPGAPVRERRFPLLFLDPALRSAPGPAAAEWTARVGAGHAGPVAAARAGARRTLGLLALAASATVVGLLLAARTVRVRAELAAMKSDFVSTVTHELKSPLASIRLVADTISMGRYTSNSTIEDYSRLLSQEGRRLTRLIDNLLTYARASDVEKNYSFEALDVHELVEDALEHCRPRLAELGFEVVVDLPPALEPIRGERATMLLVLENLVDNAIKYSGEGRLVGIRARPQDRAVRLEVFDRGQGIPEQELSRVFEKFYRGRAARAEGSGLGLAIVKRIVGDHGGRVEMVSQVGQGTTVALLLPVGGT
jgi:signal transduction histidine kinase